VYIELHHVGKAAPLFDGEAEQRVWLRLVNNSRWSVELCSFTVGKDYGESGVVHAVKQYLEGGKAGELRHGKEMPGSAGAVRQGQRIPSGYSTWDTCNVFILASGKSLVFSVPLTHLTKDYYIQVEYWPEWENRDNVLGDFPRYFVTFGGRQLPG